MTLDHRPYAGEQPKAMNMFCFSVGTASLSVAFCGVLFFGKQILAWNFDLLRAYQP